MQYCNTCSHLRRLSSQQVSVYSKKILARARHSEMPSLRAQLAHWFIWYKFYTGRHQSESDLLESIRTSYVEQDVPLDPPAGIATSDEFEVVREEKELVAGQRWKIDHVSKKNVDIESDKVIVYWHGGAFIRKVSLCPDLKPTAPDALTVPNCTPGHASTLAIPHQPDLQHVHPRDNPPLHPRPPLNLHPRHSSLSAPSPLFTIRPQV